MNLKRTFLRLFLPVAAVVFLTSCSKTENSSAAGGARLQVYLTDDPGNYESVFIDVQDVRINYSDDSTQGWTSLDKVARGTYDILRLVNDKDTLLGDAQLKAGRIQQIRLVLGSNNFVRINGINYPLQTPSAQQSGLKLKINQRVEEGVLYQMVLDFDAGRSIVKTGGGKYILKPVIRTSLKATGGSIKGFVLPSNAATSVYAIKGVDTVAGTQTANGAFLIRGLTAGIYNVSFVPADTVTYQPKTVTAVTVNNNAVTVMDTLWLQ